MRKALFIQKRLLFYTHLCIAIETKTIIGHPLPRLALFSFPFLKSIPVKTNFSSLLTYVIPHTNLFLVKIKNFGLKSIKNVYYFRKCS